MHETVSVFVALISGAALGILYFGGLRMTVQMLGRVRHPAPLFLASFLLRMAVTLLVFLFLVRSGQWQMAVAALGSFTLVRFLMVRRERQEQTGGA